MLDLIKEELDKDEYKDFYDDLGSLPKMRYVTLHSLHIMSTLRKTGLILRYLRVRT